MGPVKTFLLSVCYLFARMIAVLSLEDVLHMHVKIKFGA